jgi:glycosyltransferase involved in cell wall biosynthesis
LALPQERFQFVPLPRKIVEITASEDEEKPFVLAMGSAQRDYRLFTSVMGKLGLPTILVAGEHAVKGIPMPPNVRVLSDLSLQHCHNLSQRARVNVIPINNACTASGQVTLLEAMSLAKSTVATACVGTQDYVDHGRTGLLVPPSDATAMEDAIYALWHNRAYRTQIGENAREYVTRQLSVQEGARQMCALLDDLEQKYVR